MTVESSVATDTASTSYRPEGAQAPPSEQDAASNFDTWSDWLSQAGEAGAAIAELFALELRLAVADAGRIMMLGLAAIPVLILAWVSFATLLAWLVADYSASVGWGVFTFLGLQLAVLIVLLLLFQRYKHSLKLPLTRQHLQAFKGGLTNYEARTADPRNPSA